MPAKAKTLDSRLRGNDEQKRKPARNRLGDITDSCLGKMLDKEKNRGTFQPYLANINVRWGGFDLSNLQEMRFEPAEEERYGLTSGDLVVCEGGEPGRCAIWRDERQGMKFQKALHRLRVKEGYSVEYLFYRMLLAGRTGELAKHFIGSTIKHLTGIGLAEVELEFPEFDTQQKIAGVLSALDAKIDLNNRINAELEALAKTIYDYWFVQFDFPDAHSRPYKSSGGAMAWNDTIKREIPAGWEAGSLGDFATMERGVTYGKEDVRMFPGHSSCGVLRATNVSNNMVDTDDLVYIDASKVAPAQMIREFETLIVMSSGSKEHVGKNGVYYFNESIAFGAFCSKISPRTERRWFVSTLLRSDRFKAYIGNQCLGTNINNLRNGHVRNFPVARPAEAVAAGFEAITDPIYKSIANNTRENAGLAQLRDWLLPLLMNGQIRTA